MELAELLLTLSEPRRVADGRSRLVAEAEVSFPGIAPSRSTFTSPIGAVEADELRWYLEVYHHWPFGTFAEIARGVEVALGRWGRELFDASIGRQEHDAVRRAWLASPLPPRLTVSVPDDPLAAPLLALPWELIADERGHLFDPPARVRVRRQLSRRATPPQPAHPLRVLLVVARPEAEGLPFIDPRATAVPLLEALEHLGDRVELQLLADGTLDALRDALDEGERAGRPFGVVHFDGHGILDEAANRGLLCFEAPGDGLSRQVALVDADVLGELLADRHVSLVLLEACQTAAARGTASLAVELMRAGVGSVVAMTHTVRAISTRRFVEGFYRVLAEGEAVSTAVGAAQSRLRLHTLQQGLDGGPQAGAALQDWFVPVLVQQQGGDVPLLPRIDPAADLAGDAVRDDRFGDLPQPPLHGFVGRAKDLLLLQRRLHQDRVVTLLGDGGQGKTALAVELARWQVATRVADRAAFVSVEQHGEARVVLDRIGAQLVQGYTVAAEEGEGTDRLQRALAPVIETLSTQRVLLVVDNLETVLPESGDPVPAAVGELLTLLDRLLGAGETRMILTSRAAPPAPMDRGFHRIGPLSVSEGMHLVTRVLALAESAPARAAQEDAEWAEKLVTAVGGHPRSLVLLAQPVAEQGVEATADALAQQMQRLEFMHPGQRENSLLASVHLSLDRVPEPTRVLLPRMAVLRGNVHVAVLASLLDVDVDTALIICRQLVDAGVAGAEGPYLLPDPALAPALALELSGAEWREAEQRWLKATIRLVEALYDQHFTEAKEAALGADLTLGDTLFMLDVLQQRVAEGEEDANHATHIATCLEQLVTSLGRPRVMERVVEARKRLAACLDVWTHEAFAAEGHEVMRLLRDGELRAAVSTSQALLQRVDMAGDAYDEARYDQAMAHWLVGRSLQHAGRADDALAALQEAEIRFFALVGEGIEGAERMASVTLAEQGESLRHLGRLEEAATTLRRAISLDGARGDDRQQANVRVSLGVVRARQGRLSDALETFQRARALFEEMDAPSSVANTWHQIGTVFVQAGQAQQAERAFQRALRLRTQTEDRGGEAVTLVQLGNLYRETGRAEEAVAFFGQAAVILGELGDTFREAGARNNLAEAYHAVGRLDDAREQLTSAIALLEPLGFSGQPWKCWAVLHDVERDAGRDARASAAIARAQDLYLQYRRAGGQPLDGATRLVANVAAALQSGGQPAALAAIPPEEAFDTAALPLRRALISAVRGDRQNTHIDPFPYALRAEFELLFG